jgi:hypothetical protein
MPKGIGYGKYGKAPKKTPVRKKRPMKKKGK